ncbi:hypothetical protein [Nonomuraea soli]|uniref:Tape measure protein n=1 Tax=Nonomuraea soli TaxID=1032476 RepID=A0A7W0HVN8_9ACTN|nr:hypothetical protein [Nonomuraea soli]MBA2897398.1 hypothetical protein [Nonomuraea soli]
MKRQVDLETNIDGDPKGFNTAARSAQESARRLERENAKLEARLKTLNRQMATSGKSASLMRGELRTLIAAGALLAPKFAAAGAGAVAFAALAAPAIMRVVAAQSEMGDNWGSMSRQEKIAASGLRQLIDRYKTLAKSVEPEVLGAWNAGLGVTNSLLPRLVPLTKAMASELKEFANEAEDALNSERADQFFSFLEREAGPAMDQLGDTTGSVVGAAMSLTESLAPLATAGLGVVGMAADLVSILSDMSPELAQAAVLTAALHGPIGGAIDGMGRLAGRTKEVAATQKGASLATKALNLAAAAGPNLYVAAGVALGFLAIKAMSAKSNTDKLVDSLTVANRATGNNVSGYEKLANVLGVEVNKRLDQQATLYKNMTEAYKANRNSVNAEVVGQARAAYAAEQEAKKLAEAQQEVLESYNNTVQGADALAAKYGLTREQALRLADAVGVNLSKGVLENGQITAATAAKFDRYRAAVEMAQSPTAVLSQAWKDASNSGLDFKLNVEGLNNALNAMFNPSIAAYNATTQLAEAMARAKEAVKESKGSLDLASEAGRNARAAFGAYAKQTADTAASIYNMNLRTKGAEAATKAAREAVLAQLPTLADLAGKNASAQNQVARLAATFGISGKQAQDAGVKVFSLAQKINRLQSKTVSIKVQTGAATAAVQDWVRDNSGKTVNVYLRTVGGGRMVASAGATGGLVKDGIIRRSAGGPISGPGTGTSDDVPAWLSNGEYVINAASTKKYKPLIEAINRDRYAAGGPVTRRGAGVIRGYAEGGLVEDVPLGEMVSRFMGGKAITKSTWNKTVRSYHDAVDQLRRAERKLAADRKAGKSAKTIADDEARVRKERRDLATATEKLRATEAAYRKAKLTPAARLGASLTLGIKNTAAFIKNLETIASRGFPELAQQLLAMGGADAEKYAASAAKLSTSKLGALNKQVKTAAKQQERLEQMPAILAVKAARKNGATTLAKIVATTGLSEQQVGEAYAAMGYARGGIVTGPGTSRSDSIPAMLSRGEYVVNAAATAQHRQLLDAINSGRATSPAAAGGIAEVRVVLDASGAHSNHMLRALREMVRLHGGGNVQVALGKVR